ncbi:ABC transporter permease [Allopusillimonas ginsengisoli]|nr:ABC transporter permease [Allopusillimonas ginsengisoli]
MRYRQRNLKILGLLVPAIVVMAAYFIPLLSFLCSSLWDSQVTGRQQSLTLDNYIRLLTDSYYLQVLFRTLWVALVLTIISLVLSYPVALIYNRANSPYIRKILLLALIVPFLSGVVTLAYAWLILLGNNGPINYILVMLGLTNAPLQMVFNWTGVYVSLLHFLVPFTALTLISGFRAASKVYEDAAFTLGASVTQVLRQITLPLTVPAIISSASLTYALAVSAFVFPLLLGGGKVMMMSNMIYDQVLSTFDFPFAAAISTVFLMGTLLTMAFFIFLERFVRHLLKIGG